VQAAFLMIRELGVGAAFRKRIRTAKFLTAV
jgi:hypothetical protein